MPVSAVTSDAAMVDVRARDQLSVAEAEAVLHLMPPSVAPSSTLPALVAAVAADPRAHCAFVVDADARLIGIVSESDLDRDLALLLAPDAAAVEQTGVRALARAAHGVHETADHLMRPAVTVRAHERLGAAVRRMQAAGQETAALVDGDGRLLGYLSLFEVLAALLAEAGDTFDHEA